MPFGRLVKLIRRLTTLSIDLVGQPSVGPQNDRIIPSSFPLIYYGLSCSLSPSLFRMCRSSKIMYVILNLCHIDCELEINSLNGSSEVR